MSDKKDDDDFMSDAKQVAKGSGKWAPKKGRPKKRADVHTVNVDLSLEMLSVLDEIAKYMNVSRQAVIKSFCLDGISKHQSQIKKTNEAG